MCVFIVRKIGDINIVKKCVCVFSVCGERESYRIVRAYGFEFWKRSVFFVFLAPFFKARDGVYEFTVLPLAPAMRWRIYVFNNALNR